MSAYRNREYRIFERYCCSQFNAVHELGLKRRETVLSLSIKGF